jgi:hypothetical protein
MAVTAVFAVAIYYLALTERLAPKRPRLTSTTARTTWQRTRVSSCGSDA